MQAVASQVAESLRALTARLVITLAVMIGASLGLCVARAQFGPLIDARHAPQAKTQEELDLYLDIYTSSDSLHMIAQVEQFARVYPDSEFLGLAFQHQMAACRDLSDYDGVLAAGKKALELLPGNLNTLVTLATVIPNGVDGRADREALLSEARDFASAVLAKIGTLRIPAEISLEEWQSRRAELEAQAHEALGHVAVKSGDLEEALRQFEAAVNVNPQPTPSQWYRLGGAHLMAGRPEKAIVPLRRAAESGEATVRSLALDQLRRIEALEAE